ncbi:hypothetical protein PACID_14840 [Acidipropionibacterium acidipropionici ATCC 4875]|uniref:Uncharacterized protein n=1 Tax=Acidipropionibacterium acidipropionici (strain ATCC 4875 / DSM 20272 / JCM 6432 / NBRC 12425 / NCIMB 8070 / 4) TaxID=1171373 RepID=K7RWI0_ACIA4|nr:hypothetical protein PACID_14840 [Acidipropionibacterium acidipropionici ATCC 4875]
MFLDIHEYLRHTQHMNMHAMHERVRDSWLNPTDAAKLIPETTPATIRRWCSHGDLPGAKQLPSGRWMIPWSAVINILGFDPRDHTSGEAD